MEKQDNTILIKKLSKMLIILSFVFGIFSCDDTLISQLDNDIIESNRILVPEISVIMGSSIKVSGDTIDFGVVGQNNSSINQFYIRNDGDGDLNISALIEIIGTDASLFNVPIQPTGIIKPGDQELFEIKFTPTSLGIKQAEIIIKSNDPDKSTFLLKLVATCVAPGTVISPNGTELIKPGTNYSIRWSAFPSGNIKIDLYNGDTFKQTIAPNITDSSPYNWSVPENIDGTDYKIRVISIEDDSLWDESDSTFSIGRFSDLIITDNDGYYEPGESLVLRWGTTLGNSEPITISLYNNGSLKQEFDGDVLNDGLQQIQIPSGYSGSGYSFRVSADNNTAIYTESISFYIGSIIVIHPSNTGIKWYRNNNETIEWDTGNLGDYVSIKYVKGSSEAFISIKEENDGSYSWSIPGDITPGNDYKIKITFSEDADINDFSDNNFTIQGEALDPPAFSLPGGYFDVEKTVSITAPDGASICYTIDGSNPDPGSDGVHDSPEDVPVTSAETTIKAISVRDYYDSSPITEETYYIPYKYDKKTTYGDDTPFSNPSGVCFYNGNIYVADTGNMRVLYFSTDLGYIGKWTTAGTPYNIVSNGDCIFVSEHNPDSVRKYESDGTYISEKTGIGAPLGALIYASGMIDKVVEGSQHKIRDYDSSGNFTGYYRETTFSEPFDLSYYEITHINYPNPSTTYTYTIVSDIVTNKIYLETTSNDPKYGGSFYSDFSINGIPQGCKLFVPYLGSDLNIVVADYQNDEIKIFDLGGNLITKFGEAGNANGYFYGPYDITFDNDNNLYVLEYGGKRLQKFKRNN